MSTVDYANLYVILGSYRITGYAKGAAISVDYNVDAFTQNAGVDGEVFDVKNQDLSATITLTLQQSARANTVLSAIHTADRVTPGGLMLPVLVNEQGGGTKFAAARARIMKLPTSTWSDGGETRVWTIGVHKLIGAVGGLGLTPIDPSGGADPG